MARIVFLVKRSDSPVHLTEIRIHLVGTVLCAGDTAVNEREEVTALMDVSLIGETHRKRVS